MVTLEQQDYVDLPLSGTRQFRMCRVAASKFQTDGVRLHEGPTVLPNHTARVPLLKALGWKQKDPGSIPLRLSIFVKSCGLLRLSCDFSLSVNKTLKPKRLSSLPIFMQESFWW